MKTRLLGNQSSIYLDRLQNKLTQYPLPAEQLFVDIKQSFFPSKDELSTLFNIISQHNFAIYRLHDQYMHDKKAALHLGERLGLTHLNKNICADDDKLSSIEVRENKGQHNYIPYSNHKLSWHTDGYYNKSEQQINGFLLHCAQPAKQGGESLLLDTEIAFILLYNENPDYINALMHPNTMTIPANLLNKKIIREEQSGPVFSFSATGKLHMRYSARMKNIQWRKDNTTRDAVDFLKKLWKQKESPYIIRYTLKAGEGLACNNILHCRTAFEDSEKQDEKRLLFRGRYYDRISETHETHINK